MELHSVKKFFMFKQTHSVKGKFYFQFSFVTNEQVSIEKIQVYFSDSALVIWSSK